MEYKTDAQRRMAEVFDELGIMATYHEKDGFFTVQQGGAAAKEFLIHEGAFQNETTSRTLREKYTCITLSPDGTLTYDDDGSAVLVKLCKVCEGFFLGRKKPKGQDACPKCGCKTSKILPGNGRIPGWYGEDEERLISKKAISKDISAMEANEQKAFNSFITKLDKKPKYIRVDAKKKQEIKDLGKKFPNMQEPIDYILQCANTAPLKKNGELSFKPFVLVGGPGCGKTAFVTNLCRIIMDNKALKIDLGNGIADFTLSGSDSSYRRAKPGLILQALLDGDDGHPTKNPIIHMDELDKVKADRQFSVETVFYAILERENARHFYENYLETDINASGINYIFTANTLEGIPAPIINRLRVFTIRNYSQDELRGPVLDNFYRNWIKNNNMEADYLPKVLSNEVKERILVECHNDPRSVEDAIVKVFMETATTDQKSGHAIALFSSEEMSMGWKRFRGNKDISKKRWELPADFSATSNMIEEDDPFSDNGFKIY